MRANVVLVSTCTQEGYDPLAASIPIQAKQQQAVLSVSFTVCSWRRQPKLWLIALTAALALLLTIILCALLLGNNPPKFVAGPDILATAGYGFDTSMVVDHSGFVYYTVIPSETFLDELDPGWVHIGSP